MSNCPMAISSFATSRGRRIILLASGTGFAPIKSIVEDALRRGNKRPMRLTGAHAEREDLYLFDLLQKWTGRAPWSRSCRFCPSLAGEWQGRAGLVHEAVMADYPDLSEWTSTPAAIL